MNHVHRVLLTVDSALLHGGERFRPRHGNRVGAQLAEGVGVDRVLHYADAQAVQIFRRVYGTLAVGQVAETAFGVGHTFQIHLRKLIEQLLANRAIEHLISGFRGGEQERQFEYRHLFDKVGYRPVGDHAHIHGADLHAFQQRALVTQ